MDASKFIAIALSVMFAGLARQWWAAYAKREDAKPLELVEKGGVYVPKVKRVDKLRKAYDVAVWIWIAYMAALLGLLAFHGPFFQ